MKHLVLLVNYKTKPKTREDFIKEVIDFGVLQKIQEEDGFLAYNYYYDATDSDSILLVEEWQSEEQQQKHLKTDHMKVLKRIKEKYILDTSVRKISCTT